ncbi:hypothetical protein [Bifidobacterium panos]|uniref:Uncharacterized protein n=1 Tax=Bifidobacterium panos TaxID=2675321 RepID=A0ABX1SZG5_9BIFI|nr:hypothetical protein [Bifidobacterium sp. DSM 109963]NMN02664.1 hypothetical protein [Bifidobacterium sp. DSM 109963]
MKEYFILTIDELWGLADSEPERAERIKDSLGSFSCRRSPHIERFAHRQMEIAEKQGESRSYLLLEQGTDAFLGFFTLGLTSVDWEQVENSDGWKSAYGKKKRKSFSSGLMKRDGSHIGVFTIGELARDDNVSAEELPGAQILREALGYVIEAQHITAGRFVLVDSREILYRKLYGLAGFTEIAQRKSPNPDEDIPFVVSILPIKGISL